MENELQILNQETIYSSHFTIYGTKEEPLFLAKDVAEMIEHSNARMMLKGVSDSEKIIGIVCTAGGPQSTWFLTKDGLYKILANSRKLKAKELLKRVVESYDYPRYKNTAKQLKFQVFLNNAIKTHLKTINFEFCPFHDNRNTMKYSDALYYIDEYKIPNTNYRVDFYFPEFDLVVEYNEEHHKWQKEADKQRETEITKNLKGKNGEITFLNIEEGEEIDGIIKIITCLSSVFLHN